MRPRSERETRDYLRKKVYDKKLDSGYIDSVVVKLKEKKYLDDEEFARYYVENRFVKRGVSGKRLQMELMRKGVSGDVIERAMVESDRDEKEELRKMIIKKRSKYADDVKLIQYLCRQGFSYEIVKEMVAEYSN